MLKIILCYLYVFVIITGVLFLACNEEKIRKKGKIILKVALGIPVAIIAIVVLIGLIGFILLFITCVTA